MGNHLQSLKLKPAKNASKTPATPAISVAIDNTTSSASAAAPEEPKLPAKKPSFRALDQAQQPFNPRELEIIHTHLKDFIFHRPCTSTDLELLRRHWLRLRLLDPNISTSSQCADLVPAIVLLFDSFYRVLFELAPELRPLFHSSLQFQGKVFMYLIDGFKGLLLTGDVSGKAAHLAKLHSCYGIKFEYFNTIGIALLQSLDSLDPRAWNYEVETAWRAVYCHVTMLALGQVEKQLQRKNSKRFDLPHLIHKTMSNKDLLVKTSNSSLRSGESKAVTSPSTNSSLNSLNSLNSVTENAPISRFSSPVRQKAKRNLFAPSQTIKEAPVAGLDGSAPKSAKPASLMTASASMSSLVTTPSLALSAAQKDPTPLKISIVPQKQHVLQKSSSKNQLEDIKPAALASSSSTVVAPFRKTTSFSINGSKATGPEWSPKRRSSLNVSVGPQLTASASSSSFSVVPPSNSNTSSPRHDNRRF